METWLYIQLQNKENSVNNKFKELSKISVNMYHRNLIMTNQAALITDEADTYGEVKQMHTR